VRVRFRVRQLHVAVLVVYSDLANPVLYLGSLEWALNAAVSTNKHLAAWSLVEDAWLAL